MELRRLQATDLFAMVRLLNAIGVKELKTAINFDEINEAKKNITEENRESVYVDIGTNMIMSLIPFIIDKLSNAENEVYSFVGGIANMKIKDVAKMDAIEFIDLITAIFQKEEFKDFFKRASKLIK